MKKPPPIESEPTLWWRPTTGLVIDTILRGEEIELWFGSQANRQYGFQQTFPDFPGSRFKEESLNVKDPELLISPWLLTKIEFSQMYESRTDVEMSEVETYDLNSVPGLHRSFARLGTDEARIVRFAETYGFLGTDTTLVLTKDKRRVWGECLAQWKAEIRLMDLLVRLWDLIRTNAVESKFEELIGFDSDVVFFLPKYVEDDFNDYSSAIGEYPLPIGDPSTPFMYRAGVVLLQTMLEEVANEFGEARIQIKPFPRLKVEARTLLGTIYMHLISEVLGKSLPLVKCQVCEQWFQSRHKGTMYCSEACKQKAYRLRKETEGNNK